MTERTCSTPGCGRKHQARGLCSACYSRVHQRGTVTVPCSTCGTLVEKLRYAHKARRPVCSYACRNVLRNGYPSTDGKELVGPVRFVKSTIAPTVAVKSTRQGFSAGRCEWCDDGFIQDLRITGILARYCSGRCRKQATKTRHRLASGRFSIARRERLAIYERDGWTCQICMEPVDPDTPSGDLWSATLDHIIPQSRSLIPDHSPENLRLAHLWCNSVRGDLSYYSDADLAS